MEQKLRIEETLKYKLFLLNKKNQQLIDKIFLNTYFIQLATEWVGWKKIKAKIFLCFYKQWLGKWSGHPSS